MCCQIGRVAPPWRRSGRMQPRVSHMLLCFIASSSWKIIPCEKLSHTEIYASGSGRRHRRPVPYILPPVSSPPRKFTVVTVCPLLTHDLFAIAKFLDTELWLFLVTCQHNYFCQLHTVELCWQIKGFIDWFWLYLWYVIKDAVVVQTTSRLEWPWETIEWLATF